MYEKLQDTYKKYFPKVDPKLIEDLLLRSTTYDNNEHFVRHQRHYEEKES